MAFKALKQGDRAEAFKDGLWHPVKIRKVVKLEDGDIGYDIVADRWGGFTTSERIRPVTDDSQPTIWR